jgi:hypothetical protein
MAAAVDGEEAISHTTTTTHLHRTTIPDLAQTSRTTALRLSRAGVRASGLVLSVELLVLGLRIAWATGAIRQVAAAGGATTEAEAHGIMVARVAPGRRLGQAASQARDMRVRALARRRDVRCGWMSFFGSRMIPHFYV